MKTFIQIFFGIIVGLIGAVGTLIGLIAIIDPVGTKMADDGDPFGFPPSIMQSTIITGVFVLIVVAGLWLVLRPWRSK